MRTQPMLLSIAGTVGLTSTALCANVVIVRSLGPSAKAYPPGKTLPDSAKISLKGGDVITVLGRNAAQTLRGPGNFAASQVALRSATGRRGRFGALRAEDIAKNPSLWDLDVTKSGKMCILDTATLKLWRPYRDAAVKLRIRSNDGKVHMLHWNAGAATAKWPQALSIRPGAEYRIEQIGTDDTSSINFVAIPKAPANLIDTAQLLIQNGCENQLELLIDNASSGV